MKMKLYKENPKKNELYLSIKDITDEDVIHISLVDSRGNFQGLIASISKKGITVAAALERILREKGYDTSEMSFDDDGRLKILKG